MELLGNSIFYEFMEPTNNGNGGHRFLKVTLGNVVSWLVIIAGLFLAAGRINEKIDGLTSWKTEITSQVIDMDKNGSAYSKRSDSMQDANVQRHEDRIFRLESSINQMLPDMREMKTKIDVVKELLMEQREKKKS